MHPEIAARLDGHLAQLVTAMNRQLRAKGLPEVEELTPLTGDWLEEMLAAKSLCSD